MPDVNMPRLSDTMQEGTITRWLKKPGDKVEKGEVVAEVETDKASMEIESYSSGVLEQILVREGEAAPIGQPIARIGDGTGVQTSQSLPVAGEQAAQRTVEVASGERGTGAGSAGSAREQAQMLEHQNGFVKVSPLARRIAEEHGINLLQVKGTGPGGRIVRDDIEDFIEQRGVPSVASSPVISQAAPVKTAPVLQTLSVAEDTEVVTLSTMQKTIARRLTESKQTVPHFYVSSEIDITDALEMRQKLNANLSQEGIKISVNDLVVKACAQALEKFPEVNGSYKDGQFLLHKHINIGIAVDVPSGLLVPVIRDANTKGLRTIARETKALATKAQSGKLTPADLDAGTFSVSNLGMMDVTEFVAVINPPQAAILAVASARKVFVPINDQPVVRDVMKVTMSADHRILYGAMVARFLQEVKRQLQNVYLLLS